MFYIVFLLLDRKFSLVSFVLLFCLCFLLGCFAAFFIVLIGEVERVRQDALRLKQEFDAAFISLMTFFCTWYRKVWVKRHATWLSPAFSRRKVFDTRQSSPSLLINLLWRRWFLLWWWVSHISDWERAKRRRKGRGALKNWWFIWWMINARWFCVLFQFV